MVVTTETAAAVNCHHCEDAPCLGICQMAAISKLNGRTVVDAARCVGCRLCLMACPFGAIEFVPQPSGTRPVYSGDFSKSQERAGRRFLRAGTCDLCINRSAGPACIETCAQKALELVNTAAEKSRRNVEAALDLLQVGASAGEWQLNKESRR